MTPSILKRRRQDDDDDYDFDDGDDAGSCVATPCPKRRKRVTWSSLDEVRMYVIGEPPSPYLEKPCAPAESMFLRSPATSSPCLKLRLRLGSRGRNASRAAADSDSEDDSDAAGTLHSDDDDDDEGNDDDDEDDDGDEVDDDEEAPVVYNRRRYARGADVEDDEDDNDDDDLEEEADNDSEDADDRDDEELYASDDQSDDASSASSASEDSASLVGESDDEDADEMYARGQAVGVDAGEHDASFAEHADADPAAFAQLEHLHHVASFDHHLHHADAHAWQAPVAHADFSDHADSYHLFATAAPVLGGPFADELDGLSPEAADEFAHMQHQGPAAAAAATVVEVIVSADDQDPADDHARKPSPLDELDHAHALALAAGSGPAHLHLDAHFSIDVSGSLPREDYLAVLDALPLPDAVSAPLVVLDASVSVSVSAAAQDDRESVLVPLYDALPAASASAAAASVAAAGADLSAAETKARLLPLIAPLSMASEDVQDLKHASANLSPSATAASPDGSSVVPDSEDLEFQLSPDTLR